MVRKTLKTILILLLAIGIHSTLNGDSSLQTATACLMTSDSGPAKPDNLLGHVAEHYAFGGNIDLRHWDRTHVNIAVAGGDDQRTPEETRQLVEDASQLWNRQESVVQASVVDKPYADIVIQFVPAQMLPPRTVGRTTVTYRSLSGTLCHATIVVQQGLPMDRCLQAVAHELGHALGIQGHSPNHDDLMFESAHLPATVTARDANTLRIGYGANPVAQAH